MATSLACERSDVGMSGHLGGLRRGSVLMIPLTCPAVTDLRPRGDRFSRRPPAGWYAAMRDEVAGMWRTVSLGIADPTGVAACLMDAVVRPTLKLMVEDAPTHLRKRVDAETALALIDPGA
jgi:hypothetical protein